MKIFLKIKVIIILVVSTLNVGAATITSNNNGNWSAGGTWVGGIAPGAGDDVVIANNHDVTVDGVFTCASLTIHDGNRTSWVTINAGSSLTVTGLTSLRSNSGADYKYIIINGGTLTTGSVLMDRGGGADNTKDAYIQIVDGDCIVIGDVTMNSTTSNNYFRFTGVGTLYIGGEFLGGGGTITSANGGGGSAPTSGTVDFNGGNQNVRNFTYFNLTISGTNTKTLVGNCTVDNDFIVSSTFDLGTSATTFDVTGNSTIDGSMIFDGTTTKTTTLRGDLSGVGTIDMSSRTHTLELRGANNSIGTLTTDANSSTVRYNGSTQEVFSSTNYKILRFSPSSSVSLAGNVTVNDQLTMSSGGVNLNSYTLTLGNGSGAVLSYSAGSIAYNGYFERFFPAATNITSTSGSFYGLFPVGISTAYRPVEINSTAQATTGGYVSVSHVDASTVTDVAYSDNQSVAIQRISEKKSTITTSGLVGGTYNLNVTFTGFSSGSAGNLRLETYNGPTYGVGTHVATGGTDPTSPVLKRSGLSVTDLNNIFVAGTINKTNTPLKRVYYSRTSGGSWTTNSTWSTTACGGAAATSTPTSADDVIICGGYTIRLLSSQSCSNLTIDQNGVLNQDQNNADLTIYGDFVCNGSVISNNNGADLKMNAPEKTVSGTGVIDMRNSSLFNFQANATILSGSNLIVANDLTLSAGVVVTNNGEIFVGQDVIGLNASSKWINSTNSVITVGRTMLTTGLLDASATGNTVEYTGTTATQNVKTPISSTYYNLTVSNDQNTLQQADLIIDGDFSINAGIYSCQGFNINIRGNWSNSSNFDDDTNLLTAIVSGTVTFDGTGDQTIINSSGEVFWNLTIDKVSGTVLLNDNVSVHSLLTMTQGDINAGSSRITVGFSTTPGEEGSLSYTQGAVIGEYEKYINASGSETFPVGIATFDRPAVANFTMTSAGSVVAKFVASPPGSNGLPLVDVHTMTDVFNTFSNGYWSLTAANGFTTSSYNLELTGDGFDAFVVDAETRLLIRANSGSAWITEGLHSAATGYTARRNNLTTFSGEYCFGDDTNCARPTTSAVSGNINVCTSDADITYSVTDTPTSWYEWSLSPASSGTISGNGSSLVSITWGTTGVDATLKVVERNTCTWGDTVYYSITVGTVPPSSIVGSSNVPKGAVGKVYSVTDLGYTYTWSVVGGTITAGQGTSSVTVDWDDTEGTGSISVIASDATCAAANPVSMNVRRYWIIKSVASASWDLATTWDCNCNPLPTDNVQIRNHTVSLTAQNYTVNNLTIDAGGTLALFSGGGGTKNFSVDGDIVNNGTISGSNHNIRLRGIGTKISGTGTFDQTTNLQITSGSKIIESTAVLTVSAVDVNIAAGISVTNYGSFSITGDGKSLLSTGTWTNMENSYLKVCATMAPVLSASATGNTVEYGTNSAATITIKLPVSSAYYNLKISGTGLFWKTLSGNTIVYGDISILDASKLTVGVANLNIGGNWINTSSDANAFNENNANVTFDGSIDQTIICSGLAAGERFYNLIINKTAGNILLLSDVTIMWQLTMTQGNIDAGSKRLILGINTTTATGILAHTSGIIIGEYKKWIGGVGTYLFPLGTSTYYRPLNLTLNAGVTNGSIITKFVEADPAGTGLPLTESGISIIDDFNDGYWNFLAANSFACTDLSVTADANGFTHGGAYTLNAASRIIKSDNGAAYTLTGLGTHANAAGSVCYRNNITSGINNTGGTKFCIGHTDCPVFTAPVITGNIDACKSSTEVYSVPNDATHTYSWIVSGGTTDPNPTSGQNTSSITVTWSATASATSYVSVTENSSCYSASTKLTVKKHALPTNAITGSSAVPDNSVSGPYTVTARPGYTYTWTIPVGNGSIFSGDGTNSVYVNWGNPSSATLRCVGTYAGCAAANNEDYSVSVYASFETIADGDWSDPTIWNSNPNIPDNNLESAKVYHNVTINNASYTIKDLYIDAAGTLTHASTRDLTIEGNYYNYGVHDLSAASNINVNLTSTLAGMLIGGDGWIFTDAGSFLINGTNHTVLATANLYFIGNLSLGNSIILNNNGSVYITGDLTDANNPGSSWYNLDNSTLQIEGSMFTTRGKLYANASGNTVVYTNGASTPIINQPIKTPNSNKYWNLYITGDGTKTMQANLDVDGNITIDGNGSLDVSASNYTLNIGGNWTDLSTNGTPFNKRSGNVIFDGNADQTILNSNGETFYRLEIASQGDILRTDGDLTVTNYLTLTKGALIMTSPFKAIIPSGSSSNAGDADSFVDGIVERVGNTSFTFPTGDRTATDYVWAPIGISTITSGAGDNFQAQFFRTPPSNPTALGVGIDHVSLCEYWNITPSNGTATADVILHWKDASRSGIYDIASGDLAIAHWTGTEWEDKGGAIWGGSAVGAGAAGYITANLTSFSPVAHASKNGTNVLPVELMYFSAKLEDKKVRLEWETASEKNNDYFIVQKTVDFENIEPVKKIDGAGNSNRINNYLTYDNDPYEGMSYYRLAQVDFDGSVVYSDWKVISIKKEQKDDIFIYPNPLIKGNEFYIRFDNNSNEETLIVVKDILGNELYSKVHILSTNDDSVIAVDLNNKLPKGIYLVIGTSKNHIYNKKLIIK